MSAELPKPSNTQPERNRLNIPIGTMRAVPIDDPGPLPEGVFDKIADKLASKPIVAEALDDATIKAWGMKDSGK